MTKAADFTFSIIRRSLSHRVILFPDFPFSTYAEPTPSLLNDYFLYGNDVVEYGYVVAPLGASPRVLDLDDASDRVRGDQARRSTA